MQKYVGGKIMFTYDCNVIRSFRDAAIEYSNYAQTGMINEVSPLETLAISVSTLYALREKK